MWEGLQCCYARIERSLYMQQNLLLMLRTDPHFYINGLVLDFEMELSECFTDSFVKWVMQEFYWRVQLAGWLKPYNRSFSYSLFFKNRAFIYFYRFLALLSFPAFRKAIFIVDFLAYLIASLNMSASSNSWIFTVNLLIWRAKILIWLASG